MSTAAMRPYVIAVKSDNLLWIRIDFDVKHDFILKLTFLHSI